METLLDEISITQARGRPRCRPLRLAGDKAYSGRPARNNLRSRGIRAVIPYKDNERAKQDGRCRFDKAAYKRRCVIEQCVGWLKECRRIATRFEKLAVHFHSMISLAMIDRYLRILFRDRA